MIYSFDIDEKSLYRGITNNYRSGQSATVHTPLNQSKSPDKYRKRIYAFLEGYKTNNYTNLPEILLGKCTKKTTSQANSKIVYFYVFSKFSVDGVKFDVDASFAMYVKEEIDETITKRDHTTGPNQNYQRQKLHYPIALFHKTDGFNIDNKSVLEEIMNVNGGFAYVVKGFDIDSETNTLNFRTTMVGLKGVWKSNVFVRKKGVGLKLLLDDVNFENTDFYTQKDLGLKFTDEEEDGFYATLEKVQESSRKSGSEGERYVFEHIKEIIGDDSIDNIEHVSEKYHKSPYDIECTINGKKLYIEVKSTKSEKKVFYMSRGERHFMEIYNDKYMLILITKVYNTKKGIDIFSPKDIKNSAKMIEEVQGIKYIVK